MKIDIKSIVKSLAAGGAGPETADQAMSIHQVIDEMKGGSDTEESEGHEDAKEPEAEDEKEAERVEEAPQEPAAETVEAAAEEAETPEMAETEAESEAEEGSEEEEHEAEADEAAEEIADEEAVETETKAEAEPEMAETEAEDMTEETETAEPEETEHEVEAEEEPEETEAEAEIQAEEAPQEPAAEIEIAEAEAEEAETPEMAEPEAEAEAGTEEAPETAEPSDDEQPPADEPSADERFSAEPEAEAEAVTEDTETAEPEETEPSKLLAWGKKYGWLTGIAASFLILIAFMVIYTTMTPREIFATIDGERITFTTEEHTIADFLDAEDIHFCEEDRISVPLEAFIQEGIEFELVHAKDFTVTADGETQEYKSLELTVQKALDDVGIMVGELDIVKPKPDTLLAQDMSVIVKRVVIKEEVVEKTIPFKTIQKDDTTMMEGKSKVVKKGRNGKAEVTYKVKYIDGKEASRKRIDRKVITKARDKVVANGTMVNYNGKKYSRKLVVKAYAYTGGGTTAMGTRARVGEIAVDPSVIPLGTNVYIEGVGPRRAEDTGGNIKGNTIDIYMDTQQECINWGVRYVTIYIE